MSPGTLKKLVLDSAKADEQASGETSPAPDGPATSWSPSQRLTALQESKTMSGPALAAWRGERGVFQNQPDPGDVTPLVPENAALHCTQSSSRWLL